MKSIVLICLPFLLVICSCNNRPANSSQAESKKVPVNDGYSEVAARNYTGSAATIQGFEQTIPLEDYLRKAAGVSVIGQGSSATIRIRGMANSVNANSEPLFVVNGVTISGGFAAIYDTVPTINIQSVSVIKDASGTSIYGSRGANGVIVISLKKSGD